MWGGGQGEAGLPSIRDYGDMLDPERASASQAPPPPGPAQEGMPPCRRAGPSEPGQDTGAGGGGGGGLSV